MKTSFHSIGRPFLSLGVLLGEPRFSPGTLLPGLRVIFFGGGNIEKGEDFIMRSQKLFEGALRCLSLFGYLTIQKR